MITTDDNNEVKRKQVHAAQPVQALVSHMLLKMVIIHSIFFHGADSTKLSLIIIINRTALEYPVY